MLKSKKQGDVAEDELLEYLESIGINCQKNLVHSLRYDYDIEADITYSKHAKTSSLDNRITFEVKNDVMAKKTGNVAIEYENSRKNAPSGIGATKATFWAHRIEGEFWICPVEKLKSFIQTAVPLKTIKSGGDKNANLYIYTIHDFVAQCTPLKEMKNVEDFLNLL